MVYFQTKNLNLGKKFRVLQWKKLVNFMVIWSILRTFGIIYGHLVYLLVDWYIFPVLKSITEKNLATLDRIGRRQEFLLAKLNFPLEIRKKSEKVEKEPSVANLSLMAAAFSRNGSRRRRRRREKNNSMQKNR
jgi:hypothetical protein